MLREFCDCTADQMMLDVYKKLVPENQKGSSSFEEITDPDVLARRDELYYKMLEQVDADAVKNDGGRVYSEAGAPYRCDYDGGGLCFYDMQGRIVALKSGLKPEWSFALRGRNRPDVSSSHRNVAMLAASDAMQRGEVLDVFDAGIGVSRVIYGVRDEVRESGVDVNLHAINVVPLQKGTHDFEVDAGRFESHDFKGKKVGLFFSHTGAAFYTPNERAFVGQLEKLMKDGGLALFNIPYTSSERWRSALESSGQFEFEFLYDVSDSEMIRQTVGEIEEASKRLSDWQAKYESAEAKLRSEVTFSSDIIDRIVAEVLVMDPVLPGDYKCDFASEIFKGLADGSADKILLRDYLEVSFEFADARAFVKNLERNIGVYQKGIVGGILLKKK